MYKIKKKLNNNVVLVEKQNQKCVLLGKGIGFNKDKHDFVDEKLIDQIYIAQSDLDFIALQQLLEEIPEATLKLADNIISVGENILDKKLSFSLLVSLADHISIAFKHYDEGIVIANPLQWEIESFYPSESSIGRLALDMIAHQTGIRLPSAESTAIAMHFVNANNDIDRMEKTAEKTKIIGEVVEIINDEYNIKLEPENIHYQRFLRHLRHFLIKQEKQTQDDSNDKTLHDFVKKSFYESYLLANKITNHIEKEYGLKSTQDEISYLAIHLAKIKQD